MVHRAGQTPVLLPVFKKSTKTLFARVFLRPHSTLAHLFYAPSAVYDTTLRVLRLREVKYANSSRPAVLSGMGGIPFLPGHLIAESG